MDLHRFVAIALLAASGVFAQPRQVAITIDDLPRGGDGGCEMKELAGLTSRLMQPFKDGAIPVIGFVNEGRCKITDDELRSILSIWLDAGAELGNHTYNHRDLNYITVGEFEEELLLGERLTRPLLDGRGKTLRYLRHPFLHVGLTLDKRRASEKMIASHGYTIAPVTLDNADYLFAVVYTAALRKGDQALADRVVGAYISHMEAIFAFFEKRAVEVVGREIPQVLLIHANELNAKTMPQLLAMMRGRGYEIVSLERAMRDAAYSLPDTYAGEGGMSWIHHWSITKGMPNKGEPDEPAWITEEAARAVKR